jgi:hypothetical protein
MVLKLFLGVFKFLRGTEFSGGVDFLSGFVFDFQEFLTILAWLCARKTNTSNVFGFYLYIV